MEAVQLLTTQHREMERALEAVLEAKDPAERRKLFEKAADHLTMHIASEEEEHLFPKVLKLLSDEQRVQLADEMCRVQRRLGHAGDPRELVADETDAAAPLK